MQSLTENHLRIIDQEISTEKILMNAALCRLQVYALINQERRVELGHFNDTYEDGTPAWSPSEKDCTFQYFSLAPLNYRSILDLLRSGSADLSGCPLTDENRFGEVWKDSPGESDKPLEVKLEHVYIDKHVLEPFLNSDEKSEPAKKTEKLQKNQTNSSESNKYKSTLKIIRGLANKMQINLTDRGVAKEIKAFVDETGLIITEETVLKHIREAANLDDD